MYVPTVPEAWQWKGSDYHTVKSSYGKEMKTEKYLYYIGDNKYTIYVDKDDTVVKVELTVIRPEKSNPKTGTRRSVVPSPDTSGTTAQKTFMTIIGMISATMRTRRITIIHTAGGNLKRFPYERSEGLSPSPCNWKIC